jgi:hypothetical protein
MSKTKTFEETKRVSEAKGFLGYRNKRKVNYIRNKEEIKFLVKAISCDFPHNYPITKMLEKKDETPLIDISPQDININPLR